MLTSPSVDTFTRGAFGSTDISPASKTSRSGSGSPPTRVLSAVRTRSRRPARGAVHTESRPEIQSGPRADLQSEVSYRLLPTNRKGVTRSKAGRVFDRVLNSRPELFDASKLRQDRNEPLRRRSSALPNDGDIEDIPVDTELTRLLRDIPLAQDPVGGHTCALGGSMDAAVRSLHPGQSPDRSAALHRRFSVRIISKRVRYLHPRAHFIIVAIVGLLMTRRSSVFEPNIGD